MTRLAPSWQEVTDCLPTDRYQAARVQPKATLAKQLEEFEELWEWITNQWQMELSDLEQENLWASYIRDRLTQRTRAAVVGVGDGDCRCLSAECDKAQCAQAGCKQNPADI